MINFGSNESFIENYKRLKSSRKMGELYGCDKKTITTHAKKIGYDYSGNKERKITNIPIEEVVKQYKELESLEKVGELYGCSSTSVGNYLKNNGYVPSDIIKHTKLSHIDNEEFISNCYKLNSTEKIADYYCCSETAVREHSKKIGFDLNALHPSKLTAEDKQYIIDSYYTKTSTELAEELSVSRGMITKVWYDNDLIGKTVENPKTTEVDIVGKQFGYWKVLSKSERRNAGGCIYYNCKCEYDNCGIVKEVLGTSLRQGLTLTCGAHRNISKGNEKIKLILQEANIPFEIEKKFDTCIDKAPLPFDFFVNDTYLIEYDGLQHFQESIFDYEYTHNHDLMKNQWCQENKIPLIRIPYTHFKNLKLQDLLLETSNFIVKDNADVKSGKIGETLQGLGNPEVSN